MRERQDASNQTKTNNNKKLTVPLPPSSAFNLSSRGTPTGGLLPRAQRRRPHRLVLTLGAPPGGGATSDTIDTSDTSDSEDKYIYQQQEEGDSDRTPNKQSTT